MGVVWVWSQSNPPFKKSAYAPDKCFDILQCKDNIHGLIYFASDVSTGEFTEKSIGSNPISHLIFLYIAETFIPAEWSLITQMPFRRVILFMCSC